MKQTILKGHKWFYPRDIFPRLINRFDTVTIKFTPNESMEFDYIDPTTGKLDNDWADWKKVFGGLSLVDPWNWINIFLRNRDSIILGWRYNPTGTTYFEAAIYENKASSWIVHDTIKVVKDTKVAMTIKRIGNREFDVYLYVDSNGIESVEPVRIKTRFTPHWFARINGYYGGKNNSPGRWGGAAPKDMFMDVEFILDKETPLRT